MRSAKPFVLSSYSYKALRTCKWAVRDSNIYQLTKPRVIIGIVCGIGETRARRTLPVKADRGPRVLARFRNCTLRRPMTIRLGLLLNSVRVFGITLTTAPSFLPIVCFISRLIRGYEISPKMRLDILLHGGNGQLARGIRVPPRPCHA